MWLRDPYVENIQAEIARCEEMLEPLEAGQLQIGEPDDIQAWIGEIKRRIGMYRSILEVEASRIAAALPLIHQPGADHGRYG